VASAPARSMVIRQVHPQTEEYWGNVNPVGRAACTMRPSASRRP
jgi:hypothetical protein